MSLDVRTPADPEDFETTERRTSDYPLDFRVSYDSDTEELLVMVDDAGGLPRSNRTKSYALRYLPKIYSSVSSLASASVARAAFEASSVVQTLPIVATMSSLTFRVRHLYGKEGYLFVAGIAQDGSYSQPSNPKPMPWNS